MAIIMSSAVVSSWSYSVYTDLIIAEIHQAIDKLGGSAQPATPDAAQRVLRDLGADIDLISIVDSWLQRRV